MMNGVEENDGMADGRYPQVTRQGLHSLHLSLSSSRDIVMGLSRAALPLELVGRPGPFPTPRFQCRSLGWAQLYFG
jgi:hypothetical protein